MIKVITTVGTSLFTNYMQKEVAKYLADSHYDNCSIDKEVQVLQKNGSTGTRNQHKITGKLVPRWIKDVQKTQNEFGDTIYIAGTGLNIHCSAEVQTLVELAKSDKYKDKLLEVHLLCTDTALSQLAGQILEEHIFEKGNSLYTNVQVVSRLVIKDLQVEDAQKFEDSGFFNLVEEVKNIREIAVAKQADAKLLLNISGGYKALIPPLTIVGQLYDIPIVYLYESSDKLIEVDKMPFQFDMNLLEPYSNYFSQKYVSPEGDTEEAAMEELVNLNLFKKIKSRGSYAYQRTIMGTIVGDYIKNHYPLGQPVLGFYMEHKFYELYIEESELNYKTIKRSHQLHKPEIDLFIKTYSDDYIVCEVKSFNQINTKRGTKKGFLSQLRYQIKEGFLKETKCPKEYHLLLYKHKSQKMEHIAPDLNNLRKCLHKFCPSCEFKVFQLVTDYTLRSKAYFMNPYQQFMSRKLTFSQSKHDKGKDKNIPNKKTYELVTEYTAF